MATPAMQEYQLRHQNLQAAAGYVGTTDIEGDPSSGQVPSHLRGSGRAVETFGVGRDRGHQ